MPASNAPETPRQRMIGLMYIILLCMLALNVSSDVLGGFELVDDSLTISTQNAGAQNNSLYTEFEANYKANPAKTKEWYDLAQDLKRKSNGLYSFVDSLKWEIVREVDGEGADIHNIKKRDNTDVAARIMLPPTGRKAEILKKAINDYREHIIVLVNDSLKKKLILENFSTKPSKRAKKDGHNWESSMFENMPVGAVIAMFTKLQNDIRNAEGVVLHELKNNIDVGDFRVNQIKAYVIPTSENVVRGGSYRANIILSAEDSTQQPNIFVNGRMLDPRKRGQFEVFASTSGVFPVQGYIEMRRGDGSLQRHPFSQKYTVVEPMATVSNTLMNVFYAGINNKVSISVPGVPSQQITASSNNGTLSRSGNNWIARPAAIGKECVITVTALMDGRSREVAKSIFRVRPLPEPRAFIEYQDANGIARRYKGGAGFSKAKILAAPGLVAALDDDLLEVNFTVLSFNTFVFDSMNNTLSDKSQGANFSDSQKEKIRGLGRGKHILVTNIRAVGPDRVEQVLAPMDIIIN